MTLKRMKSLLGEGQQAGAKGQRQAPETEPSTQHRAQTQQALGSSSVTFSPSPNADPSRTTPHTPETLQGALKSPPCPPCPTAGDPSLGRDAGTQGQGREEKHLLSPGVPGGAAGSPRCLREHEELSRLTTRGSLMLSC